MLMDRHHIITVPNANLRKSSRRIKVFNNKVNTLCRNMEHATLDWEDHREHELGVALAAIQIDQAKRAVILRHDFENKDDRSFIALINPKIIRLEGEIVTDYEGCLSVPDVYGLVPRYERVKIKAQDLEGNEFKMLADGFLARVLQHEIDHTSGKLFIDYLKDKKDAFYKLTDTGKLEPMDYDKIETSLFLWE